MLGALYLFLWLALRVILADLQPPPPAAPSLHGQARGRAPEPPSAEVEVVASAGEPALGTRFGVGRSARIGRHPTAEIHVADAYVSAEHARLYARGRRYWIEDLGSTNGTLVNSVRVTTAVPLEDGDRITIGPIILRFTVSRPARVVSRSLR